MVPVPAVPARRYRSALRENQARRTRRRLLEAATAVFLDRGYAGTTMRAVAAEAEVSVPTIESLFATKARLLKAAIDVAIAGDDEPVAVLDRPWAQAAEATASLGEFLALIAQAITVAQQRSSGLVLAVFEGSSLDTELAALRDQMVDQREATASWIVREMTRLAPLRSGCEPDEAIDVVWLLMDPAVFSRLTRQRGWTMERFRRWLADALARLLVISGEENHE